jgi:hypothetical protein
MHAMNILAYVKPAFRRLIRREDGSSIVELALVFPILLLLFVGIAELGRLYFTYTTLAKATKVGARYLSTSRNAVNGEPQEIIDEMNTARNLVVCGNPSSDPTNGCTGLTPIVPGLTTANVDIPALIVESPSVRYWKVTIQNYPYTPGVFNLSGAAGKDSDYFYFSLTPGTEMRYMPN